jgi:hypothetical protein
MLFVKSTCTYFSFTFNHASAGALQAVGCLPHHPKVEGLSPTITADNQREREREKQKVLKNVISGISVKFLASF